MLYLRKFQLEHPGMGTQEANIEAGKRYVPPSGKLRSYEKLYQRVWRARNPAWKTLWGKDESKTRMRDDFLERI